MAHSFFGEQRVTGGDLTVSYDLQLRLEGERELFVFQSVPTEDGHAEDAHEIPLYLGSVMLDGDYAHFEITELIMPEKHLIGFDYLMSSEFRWYANSDVGNVRAFAGSAITKYLFRQYLEGSLEDNPQITVTELSH